MDEEFLKNGGKILTFSANGKVYAFNILSVTDIIEIPEITNIPKTPAYLCGLMNHRGKAVPVMDFRKRLGLPDYNYDKKSCVIVIEINSMQIGIIVDRVIDVENISTDEIAPSPVVNSTVQCFITRNNTTIFLLNAEMLVRGKV